MKITSGLVACAVLASGITAASADTPVRRHYNQLGARCSADEIANPPMVKVRLGSKLREVKAVCLTRSEWTLEKSKEAEKKLYAQRERELMSSGAPTAAAAINSEAALSR